MKVIVPTITRVGLRDVFAADNEGLKAEISHIAFGDGIHEPTGGETALVNERARVPISGGKWQGDFTIAVAALLDVGPSFWIREVGIYLSTGKLLAIWSDPEGPLEYKTADVPLLTKFMLTMRALPAGSVTVDAGDIDLNLFFDEDFARMGGAIIANMTRHVVQSEQLDEAMRQISSLQQRITR